MSVREIAIAGADLGQIAAAVRQRFGGGSAPVVTMWLVENRAGSKYVLRVERDDGTVFLIVPSSLRGPLSAVAFLDLGAQGLEQMGRLGIELVTAANAVRFAKVRLLVAPQEARGDA